jgi:hypothetical protein
VLVTALSALWAAVAPGCSGGEYSQDTPDDLVRTAVAMVKKGDAKRLPDLIYAEDDRMRAVLKRLGVMLGHMQELAAAIQERFPAQVAALKAKAEEAAREGASTGSPFSIMMAGAQGGRRAQQERARAMAEQAARDSGVEVRMEVGGGGASGGAAPAGTDPEAAMQRAIGSLFADPYGWIDRNAGRLSTTREGMPDDMAAVLLDGQPVLPPLGIPLKQVDGKWYVALPTALPGVSNFMPRTNEEWGIIASVIRVLDQTVVELTADVRANKVGTIDDLADKAGEKTIVPAMLAFGAYMREMDVRQKRERLARQYSRREKEWLKAARNAAVGDAPAMPERLGEAVGAVTGPALDRLARKDRPPNIEQMSDAQFAELLQGWMGEAGLKVSLALPLAGPEIDRAIAAWDEQGKKAAAEKQKARSRQQAGR